MRPARELPRKVLFLIAASLVALFATIFAGVPIAQAHGDARNQALTCLILTGILGSLYWILFRTPGPRSRIAWMACLLPVYALLQLIPIPLTAMRVVSPSRAALTDALGPIGVKPAWAPISVTPSATLYQFLVFAACATLFLVIYDLANRFAPSPWPIVLPLGIIGILQAALGLLQTSGDPAGIATGTYTIRNHFAGLLEMILPFPLLFAFPVFANPRRQIASILTACAGFAAAIAIVAALLASLSRAGFFAALVSLVVVIAVGLSRARSKRVLPVIVIALIAAAGAAVLVLPSARLIERLGDVQENSEDRSLVWRDTLNLVKAYPAFGCGLGAYESAFLPFKHSAPALDQDYAHNDYLQYLAELGVLGFLTGLIPLAYLLIRLGNGIRHPDPRIRWLSLACAASMIAIGAHSLVDFNLYVPGNLFVFAWIAGLIASLGESKASTDKIILLP